MNDTILIVEDNPLNRVLFVDLLEAAGYVVYTSVTAEDGLHRASQERPDLILMDIQLPGMDGLEAVRRLRNDPTLSNVTAVALTAQAMKGDDVSALEAGFDGYISKPIDTRRFADAVRCYLPAANVP